MSYSRYQEQQNADPAQASSPADGADKQIKVDGFAQVVAMLEVADPEFRESLLRRIAARDWELANNLRAQISSY